MRASAIPTVAEWQRWWPNCRPISYELRNCAHDRWVRFHSLPESKRYAEKGSEYDELLGRHMTVLTELSSHAEADLLALTFSWSDSPDLTPRDPVVNALLPAQPWTSVRADEDPEFERWAHVYIGTCHLGAPNLRQLLRMVADDELGGLVLFDRTLQWLYVPYDGGTDVILPTAAARDQCRHAHRDWLSAHPSGL